MREVPSADANPATPAATPSARATPSPEMRTPRRNPVSIRTNRLVAADPTPDESRTDHRGVRVLIVDLNNFATFPTMAIGILVAALRNRGFAVSVISPLAHDVPALERERREWFGDHLHRKIRLSNHRIIHLIRETTRRSRSRWRHRAHPGVIREVSRELRNPPHAILLSAYLEHFHSVQAIGRLAGDAGTPLLLGGPMFNQPEAAAAWRRTPGLTAIVGGEVDISLPEIVGSLTDGRDLLRFPGITLPDGRASGTAPPLRDLDRTPVPDYTDFPWDRYRLPLIPIMTGRGCQWSRCTFCSDVVSASGRTFRTRSVESVMHEIRELSQRHQSRNFLFLDLNLNSNPAMWRGIIERIQANAPGAQWVGTVHVDTRPDNGLSRRDLRAAARAGMRRISFGLESGSQRMLDAMEKGCTVEGNSEFIRDAWEAGLSVRCTMFRGYPGETAEDIHKTAAFLEQHEDWIDRIRLNELAVLEGTPLFDAVTRSDTRFAELRVNGHDARNAILRHENTRTRGRDYRRAMNRLLAVVHRINRREVRRGARAFDGVM